MKYSTENGVLLLIDVFVCEDDRQQRERLETYIRNYIMVEELDMRLVLSTEDPDKIIEYVKEQKNQGLYFLDVDLNHEKTGIMLGAEIRKYDANGTIVFVTTHAELTYLTFMYKVEAMDYITKDEFTDIQQRVVSCIQTTYDRYLNDQVEELKQFQTKIGDRVINVPYEDILFFESSSQLHKVIMHTENRQVEFYGKLKELALMDDCFYRCHNSYVVNRSNITEVDVKKRILYMKNGSVCYASNRSIKGLIQKV